MKPGRVGASGAVNVGIGYHAQWAHVRCFLEGAVERVARMVCPRKEDTCQKPR